MLFLIGLNTEQVYISWLCETCFTNSRGRRGQTRGCKQPQKIRRFPHDCVLMLSDWGPASVCVCVGGGFKSPLRRSLWPLTRTGSYTGVKPRQKSEKVSTKTSEWEGRTEQKCQQHSGSKTPKSNDIFYLLGDDEFTVKC